MSDLLVRDAKAEMSWEKSFNDVSKRHHIRIWKQSATWDGREIWVAAATHDVDFAYLRPGNAMTHKIAEDVDTERDKVVNDMVFTSCVDVADDMERLDVPMVTRNATGDPMRTDTRMSILELNGCETPNGVVSADGALPLHGSKMQRFARREILSFRSDVLRENCTGGVTRESAGRLTLIVSAGGGGTRARPPAKSGRTGIGLVSLRICSAKVRPERSNAGRRSALPATLNSS